MQLKKLPTPPVASPEHHIAQQAQALSAKYKHLFTNQASGSRDSYAYPANVKQSAEDYEMRALEANAAKGGHGVPLSSESLMLASRPR